MSTPKQTPTTDMCYDHNFQNTLIESHASTAHEKVNKHGNEYSGSMKEASYCLKG
jgi:hypothetical protein